MHLETALESDEIARDPVDVASDARDRGRRVGARFEHPDGAVHGACAPPRAGGAGGSAPARSARARAIPSATIAAASGASRCTKRVPVSLISLIRSTRNVRHVIAGRVERDEIPRPLREDESIRLDQSFGDGVVRVRVGEAQPFGPGARERGRHERVDIRRGQLRATESDGHRPQRGDLLAQLRGQHPVELGERRQGRRLDTAAGAEAAPRRPIATATASSSSSTSGGRCPPAPSA